MRFEKGEKSGKISIDETMMIYIKKAFAQRTIKKAKSCQSFDIFVVRSYG
jgi:hypothetical protein